MTCLHPEEMKKDLPAVYLLFLTFIIAVLLSLFMGGCGAGKKVARETMVPEPAQQRVAAWYALMRDKRQATEMEKLETVNNFFNQLEFIDDQSQWGSPDYWATPQEMLISNGGDCEDFATAKYFTLRHLDISDSKMRLTFVKAIRLKQPHMVLSYYGTPGHDPLILDSLVREIYSASERPDLIPIYSFNGQGLWLARKQGSENLSNSERLSLWQELQTRFSQEAVAAPLPE